MQKILESYLRRLTNLSGNNRSLLLLRLISDQFIDLHDLDFNYESSSFEIVKNLIAGKKKIDIARVVDTHDGNNNEISQRLKKIQRIEKFIFEERGAKDLYVGWPFVRGKFKDGTLVRCPLLFFPVDLSFEKNTWSLHLRTNVNLTLNKTFLLAYSFFNELKPDQELLDKVFDDFDKDSTIFRSELYELLKESSVEINFNQENFIDSLRSFTNFKKNELDSEEKTGSLKLHPEAVLGIFPQSGSYLVPDYVHMLENNKFQGMEDLFLSRNSADQQDRHYDYLKNTKEELTFTPFELDVSQEKALKTIKNGNSLIVQGPPGTGKSQLICNLISDFIARGKSVLLVCQKKAALDIVHERLKDKNLDDFIGLMHDFKNDRKTIYEQIASQIDRLNEYQQRNNTLDSIQLERTFLQSSRTIDQLTEELEEFKFALYDTSECGRSVKELYLSSNPDEPAIDLRHEYQDIPIDKLATLEKKVREYFHYARILDRESHPWFNRKSFGNYGINELRKIKEVIAEIRPYQESLGERVKEVLDNVIDLETANYIISKESDIRNLIEILSDHKVYESFQHMTTKDVDEDSAWLSNLERTIMPNYKGFGPEISLSSSELGRFQEVLNRGIKARRNFFSWASWRFLSKDKTFLTRVLVANGLKSNRQSFNTLIEKIDNRLNIEHNITVIQEKKWLKGFPENLRKIDIQNWFYYQKLTMKARGIFISIRNLKDFISIGHITYEELKEKLENLLTILKEVPDKHAEWQQYLTTSQINRIANSREFADKLKESVDRDFESICEFDQLNSNILPYELKIIERITDASSETNQESEDSQEVSIEDHIKLLHNSIRLSWIDHIETKYPILRTVSSAKFEKTEKELQEAIAEKKSISNEILLLKARERTYQDLEYNRLNNLVTYRDLLHQVTKKRRIWPLRKLMTNFREELFDLVPCWMASPESASAIFPMEQAFDLVIFDEASQCYAEKGLPAMLRGKQVVIAGDDKQLQPLDIYKVRWEDDNDQDIPELEIDSLLNLAKRHLAEVQLKGHYRSQSPELMDFSNKHFYNGNLTLLPDYNIINKEEPAIVYNNVEGTWEDNINNDEAWEIVNLIDRLIKEKPDKSIGVVTFNAKQQGHIMDLMEQYSVTHKIIWPDHIFVKNIENVQGDEKDIIIFSTGYAPDKKGKMNLKFGSLNVAGGENRLNVAISRAREKIYVITSLFPTQLHVGETKNEGPKLLKEYLTYAFNVSEGKFTPTPPPYQSRENSWYLKNIMKDIQLPSLNFTMSEELPFADLTVCKGGKFKSLILTDDHTYFESISPKDPHAYKPFLFGAKNWRYRQFFSREIWRNRQQMEERVARFISSSLE